MIAWSEGGGGRSALLLEEARFGSAAAVANWPSNYDPSITDEDYYYYDDKMLPEKKRRLTPEQVDLPPLLLIRAL